MVRGYRPSRAIARLRRHPDQTQDLNGRAGNVSSGLRGEGAKHVSLSRSPHFRFLSR